MGSQLMLGMEQSIMGIHLESIVDTQNLASSFNSIKLLVVRQILYTLQV
jgi:hypothetical protein